MNTLNIFINSSILIKAQEIIIKKDKIKQEKKTLNKYIKTCVKAKICPTCGESLIYKYTEQSFTTTKMQQCPKIKIIITNGLVVTMILQQLMINN